MAALATRRHNVGERDERGDLIGSWVVVSKATGQAVFETFNKKTADAVNRQKYDVVPIGEYLGELNRKLKSNPHLSQIAYLNEEGEYLREGPIFNTKEKAFAEAKAIQQAGENVQVVWKDSRTGVYHEKKFIARKHNPGSFYQRTMHSNTYHEIGEVTTSPVYGKVEITDRRETGDPEKYKYEYDITPVTKRERTRRSMRPSGPGPGKRYRPNPESSASSMYSSFHGTPSTVIDEYREQEHYHSNLAALGELVGLKVRTVSGYDVTLGFEGGSIERESNPGVDKGGHSEAHVAGQRWLWAKIKTAKGSFNSTNAPDGYLKKLGLESTRHMSGAYQTEAVRERIQKAQQIYKDFMDGVDYAWQKHYNDQHPSSENPNRQANAFWPFSSFTHTTIYHVPSGHRFTTSTKHAGHTIYKSSTKNGYVVPSLDRDSVFDSVKDAKKFIDHWAKRGNPKGRGRGKGGPFASSQRFVGDAVGTIYRPIDAFTGMVAGVADKGLKAVGVKGNPDFSLYQAALKADNDYQAALEKEYGKRAGDMRYRTKEQTASIRKLGEKKVAADEKWLKEVRKGNPRRSNPDHVLLCSTEDGDNLQLIGGDQSLDLSAIKIDGDLANKELVTIGEVWGLNYRTEKTFGDGGNEDGLTEYIHILGPKETKPPRGGDLWQDAVPPKPDTFGTGELPTLVYDKRNHKLLLSGGIYHIDQPLMGTSAGIEH